MTKWVNNVTNADGTPHITTFSTVRERIDSDMDFDLDFDSWTEFIIDGRTFRLKLGPCEYGSIMDEQGEGVWCGRLEWSASNDYGKVRPEGFDGNAEVLDTDRNMSLWWQPMEDCKPNTEVRAQVRKQIVANLTEGYYEVEVVDEDGRTEYAGNLDAPVWPDRGEWHRYSAADLIAEMHADYIDASWAMPDLQRWMKSGKS